MLTGLSPAAQARAARWLPALALGLLTLAGFWPVLYADFVWDDKAFLEAPPVAAGLGGLWDIWFNPAQLPFEAHYWPLLYTSFWLENKLWGFEPAGFHATNLALHMLNAALLWRLLVWMRVPGAWLIAAIFALHPMRVEPVAWVMSRKDLLASCFYLLAFGCWIRHRACVGDAQQIMREKPPHLVQADRQFRELGRQAGRAYLGLLLLFAAGMFSKTFVITLPAVLLVWVWWRAGAVRQGDLWAAVPLLAVGLAIALVDLNFYAGRAEINFDYTLAERLVIASKALWFYALQPLWPWPLPIIYPHFDIDPARLLNWLPLLAGLGAAWGLWRAQWVIGRGALAALLFFAITLAPMLGLVGSNSYMEYSFVADRYLYLAGAGVAIVLVAGAVALLRQVKWGGYAGVALAALLLAGLGGLTWRQAGHFQNEIALFGHVVSLNPAAHSAHYNLGIALMEEGRLDEAEAAYKAEVARDGADPKYLQAVNHLASLHFEERRYARAMELYAYSAEMNPEDADTHQNLGSALAQLRRYKEALASFQRALALNPELEMARDNMALAQEMLDKQAAAPGEPAP